MFGVQGPKYEDCAVLYIGGLKKTLTQEQLAGYLGVWGPIENCEVGRRAPKTTELPKYYMKCTTGTQENLQKHTYMSGQHTFLFLFGVGLCLPLIWYLLL